MDARQLVKQIRDNRELLVRNNQLAFEHFQMLKQNYVHLINEEVALNFALSEALYAQQARSDYRQAIDISLAALDKYKTSVFKNLVAMHMRNIGHSYAHLGEFALAEMYLVEALDNLDESEPNYKSNKALILNNLAMTCEFKAAGHEKAIDYLNQAIELLAGDNDRVKRANCLMGLGNIYNTMNNLPEALDKYRQAAGVLEGNYSLADMASAYNNMGNCYLKMQELELAESYHQKAFDLRMKLGTPYPIGVSYFNLGMVHKTRGRLEQAGEYLNRACKMIEELGDKPFLAQINKELDSLEALKRNTAGA
ncbi:MAG TPA: tetratricopeptide repeat protein [Chitinophagales bacterium]|nr:tetratricopeptide repeat protein [Chitinophagales bacterium]